MELVEGSSQSWGCSARRPRLGPHIGMSCQNGRGDRPSGSWSGEQVFAWLKHPHERPALVVLEPAFADRVL